MHSRTATAERTLCTHNLSICRSTVGVLIIIYRRVEGMKAILTLGVGAGPRARL